MTGSRSWDKDYRSWRHADPSIGKTKVSASLYSLLFTIRNRLCLRWRKGISDAFQMLEVPGQLVGKSEVRAILSAVKIHPTVPRFDALWSFLDQQNAGKIRFVDFKEAFEISEDLSEGILQAVGEEEAENAKCRHVTMGRRSSRKFKKKKTRDLRSVSAPPGGGLFSDLADEDDLQDVLRSLYDVTFASALKAPTFDKFTKWSPLGRRGYAARPQTTMRPMSVQMGGDDARHHPDAQTRSVHFQTRDMGSQADDATASSLHKSVKMPTLTPFSNLRNGSGLKMQWRRWTGGETRGPSKSSNQDPAAPGATASLLLGAGEFKSNFDRSLEIAKSLDSILQKNPNLVFDMQQRGFKSTSPNKKLDTPTGTNAQEMKRFVQTLFPTGLSSAHS